MWLFVRSLSRPPAAPRCCGCCGCCGCRGAARLGHTDLCGAHRPAHNLQWQARACQPGAAITPCNLATHLATTTRGRDSDCGAQPCLPVDPCRFTP